MSLVSFEQLMADAERSGYAVGYFESWSMDSLLAVADAAEALRSPVILGFSGIHLPDSRRVVMDRLSPYAAFGLEVCREISVPACLLLNECSYMDWLMEAIALNFQLVMFTDESLEFSEQIAQTRRLVDEAHRRSVAVEGEMTPLPGVNGAMITAVERRSGTDCAQAVEFVERTGVDALAVDLGQAHFHGRTLVRLNLDRLVELKKAIHVPLILHAASSVYREDLAAAIRLGIRKINVGSNLKQAYFDALRRACAEVGETYHPYEVIGSGLSHDVLTVSRTALKKTVEDLMHLFGSAGKANNQGEVRGSS